MLAAAPPQTPPGVRTEAVAMSTEPVFTAWDYPIFALLTMLNLAAVAYLLIRWFSWGDLATHPLLFVLSGRAGDHTSSRPKSRQRRSPIPYPCHT
jgi:hypothetical protein